MKIFHHLVTSNIFAGGIILHENELKYQYLFISSGGLFELKMRI